jgi:hypothetical protein
VRVNRGCTPGQMIRRISGMRGNEGCTAFAWSKKGRATYRGQWLFIRSTPDDLAMVRAGHDARRCSSNTSWGPLPLQCLLEIRGFLEYVVWTYMWLNLCIKGLHLTVDSWRPGRAEDGFKWTAKERRRKRYHGMEEEGLSCQREFEDDEILGTTHNTGMAKEAPETVIPVERYFRNLACLQDLTSSAEPLKQLYRAERQSAFFVIGDASSKAKGNVIVELYGVDYESGAWNLKWREKSSNCREAKNLTDRLERLVADGALQNHEVFLITDNSAFEGAFY